MEGGLGQEGSPALLGEEGQGGVLLLEVADAVVEGALFEVVRPNIVVKRKNKILGKDFDRENQQIQDYLNRFYRPIHRIDKAVILQRLELE